MLRKPRYCCNCGDKVERVEWRIWNSTRFCELCETEFLFDEWWPRAAISVILIFGFTGIGFHYGGNEKQNFADDSLISVPQKIKAASVSEPAVSLKPLQRSVKESPSVAASKRKQDAVGKLRESLLEAPEDEPVEVYYCGAMTKKGTPCARRVKDGGRCWQHREQDSKEPK